MSPEKVSERALQCDSCLGTVPPGAIFQIDSSGYLLCSLCAKDGDLKPKGV